MTYLHHWHLSKHATVCLAAFLTLVSTAFSQAPNLRSLSKSCFILHDPTGKQKISQGWEEPIRVMKNLTLFEDLTNRIADVVCAEYGNKSVLIVGEASTAYRYFLASLAASRHPRLSRFAHVEIDLPKIVEGHTLLGQVQEYWQKQIQKPAANTDVILYVSNLSSMIGLGASNRSSTGVETIYSPSIQGGKLRSIAFIDYFNYSRIRANNNYVVNSFADTVFLPELGEEESSRILLNYAGAFLPQLKLSSQHVEFIKEVISYYQPNKPEPQRSLAVFKELTVAIGKASKQGRRFVINKNSLKAASMKAAQVPDWIIQKDFTILKGLTEKLRSRVIGQDEALNAVVNLSRVGYAGARTDDKPIASVLFAGPTGTGKTYISEQLSKALGLKMITIDMTTYRSASSMDRFLDVMTDNLTLTPYGVYVFEEIDKANIQVLDRLYFLLDEGVFYNRNQTPLSARGAFVIMTTNAGYDVIIRNRDKDDVREMFELALLDRFRPSFLNRFDRICMFRPFTNPEFEDLAKLHVRLKINKMKETYNWNLEVDEGITKMIARLGRSETFGARPTLRMVNSILSLGVTNYQIEKAPLEEGARLSLGLVSEAAQRFKLALDGGATLEYTVKL